MRLCQVVFDRCGRWSGMTCLQALDAGPEGLVPLVHHMPYAVMGLALLAHRFARYDCEAAVLWYLAGECLCA